MKLRVPPATRRRGRIRLLLLFTEAAVAGLLLVLAAHSGGVPPASGRVPQIKPQVTASLTPLATPRLSLAAPSPTRTPSPSPTPRPAAMLGPPTPTPAPLLWAGSRLPDTWPKDAGPQVSYVAEDGYHYLSTADGALRARLVASWECPSLRWAPDGQAYTCYREGYAGGPASVLTLRDVTGLLLATADDVLFATWSRDGEYLAVAQRVGALAAAVERVVEPVRYVVFDRLGRTLAQLDGVLLRYGVFASNFGSLQWSPDGGRLAYLSTPNEVSTYHVLRDVSRPVAGAWQAVLGWTHGGQRLLLATDMRWSMFALYRAWSVEWVFGEAERAAEFDDARSVWLNPNGVTALYRAALGVEAPLLAVDWATDRRTSLVGLLPRSLGKGALEIEAFRFSPDGGRVYWRDCCADGGPYLFAASADGSGAVRLPRPGVGGETPAYSSDEQYAIAHHIQEGFRAPGPQVLEVSTGRLSPLPPGSHTWQFRPGNH